MVTFGTRRVDVYMRAVDLMPAGSLVREVRRPRFGAKLATKTARVVGACVDNAVPGEGVWVRVSGPIVLRRA